MDPTLCTHIIYAFATLKDHKLTEGDEKDAEMYDKVVALREKNPNLKVSFLEHSQVLLYIPLNVLIHDSIGI